jgi:ABC-type polysaccharide/polyol phosphate export permease
MIAALATKAMGWSFFVASISSATGTLTGAIHLLTKIYFPRAVLPLAVTLAQVFDLMIGMAVLGVLLPFLGADGSWALLWAPVLVLLLVMLTVASAVFLSCANLFFRDVKYIVQVMLMFGIFFTPVFFEPAQLGPKMASLFMLNPLAPLLEGLRLSLVEGHNLLAPLYTAAGTLVWTPLYLAYSAFVATAGLAVSATVFHKAEAVFAEVV